MRSRSCWVGTILSVSIAWALPSFADSEAAPHPYVVTASRGQYYFKMVPEPGPEEKGRGYVYRVDREADELLYETSGWYSRQVFLSSDGTYLCRTANWPRTAGWYAGKVFPGLSEQPKARTPEEEVALEFYKKGQPLKTYHVADLVADLEKLRYSMSHYTFLKGPVRFYEEYLTDVQRAALGTQDSHGLYIVAETVDDRTYVFDMRTGDPVDDKELPKALAMTEDDAQAIAAAYLQKQGPGWTEPVNCEPVGDFQYAFYCRSDRGTHRVTVDRRTGNVTLERATP